MSDPVDKSNWLWCRGCQSAQPPEGRKGFRCAKCAKKAAESPNRWKFDQYGNVISKGQSAKKQKAGMAVPASKTTKE